MPKLEIEVSNDFLRLALHNFVSGIVGCGIGEPLITDVEIAQVEALRGDDRDPELQRRFEMLGIDTTEERSLEIARHVGGGGFRGPVPVIGDDAPPPRDVTPRVPPLQPTGPVSARLRIVSTFVRIGLTFRWLPQALLDQLGTSDAVPPLPIGAASDETNAGLLFRVTGVEATSDNNVTIRMSFVNALSGDLGDTAFAAAFARLRTSLSNLPITLPTRGLLGILPVGGRFTNVGVAAAPRRDGAGGLRIGLDLELSDDTSGWATFYAPPGRLRLGSSEPFGLFIAASVLEDYVERTLGSRRIDRVLLGFPSASWNGETLRAEIEVTIQDYIAPVGTAYADITPSVSRGTMTDPDASLLTLRVCFWFEPATIYYFLLGLGEAVFVPAADATVEAAFGPKALIDLHGFTAGPIEDRCRSYSREVHIDAQRIGTLRLDRLSAHADGVFLGGRIAPREALLPLGHLATKVLSPWGHPFEPCEPPTELPQRQISLRNDGRLPLRVCAVAQRLTPQANVSALEIYNARGEPLALPFDLAPNAGMRIVVRALVSGNAAYDPTNPPPLLLRILSSAGCRVIDLNEDRPALPPDPAELEQIAATSEKLCEIMELYSHFPGPLRLPPLPFRFLDPWPIEAGDVIRSRIRSVARSGRVRADGAALRTIEKVVYRESSVLQLPAAPLGTVRVGRHAFILMDGILARMDVVPSGLGATSAAWIPGASLLARVGAHTLAAGGDGTVMVFDRSLRLVERLAIRAHSVATTGSTAWLATHDAIHAFSWEQGSASLRTIVSVRGVDEVVAAAGTVFARVGEYVFDLANPRCAVADGAWSLIALDGLPAIATEDGVIVLDAAGSEVGRFDDVPWWTSLVEWEDIAIEWRRGDPRLTLHERHVCAVDLESLPG